MKHLKRMAAALVCLCLASICTLSKAVAIPSDSPVYRSDFSLRLGVNADGFPKGTGTDYGAWEDYLNKLSLRGVIDTQNYLQKYSRIYFDGGLYINENKTLPFTYDTYANFRYVRSPALDGASVHFQMKNFFEFMLKPYYFMEMPTQYIALLMYPEASQELGLAYYKPISEALGGSGTRVIPYEKLEELALALDELQFGDEDEAFRLYFYLTCLLTEMGYSDDVYERFGCLENWLAWIDPEQKGLSITAENGAESWMLGEYEVFSRESVADGTAWTLSLPDEAGCSLLVDWRLEPQETGKNLNASIRLLNENEEEGACAALVINGMPKESETEAFGKASFSVSGSELSIGFAESFEFRYSRDAEKLPYTMALGIDWIHPETGKAALTVDYRAKMEEHDNTVLIDRDVDDQEDFFHLNESVIEEYKERFMPTLALGFAPFLLEMPLPVISDVTAFMMDSGALEVIGLE